MIFAKLDVCFWRHEKFIEAGLEACAFWAGCLARLREDSSSDGFIKPTVLGLILKVGDRKARKLGDRLVEVGLFEARDGGYLLLGYALKNETKEDIEARRAEVRDRVAASRARRNGLHEEAIGTTRAVSKPSVGNVLQPPLQGSVTGATVPGSDSDLPLGLDLGSSGERDPEIAGSETRLVVPVDDSATGIRVAPRTFAESTDDGLSTLGVAQWCAGIRSVTKAAFFPEPTGPARIALIACLRAGMPPGVDPLAWALREGAAYATARDGGSLTAPWYCEWVGSGRHVRGSKSGRPVQPKGPNGERLWKVGGST